MKDVITLKELAAVVVRRGRLMIILALVLALALGAFGASRQISEMNSPKNTDQEIAQRNEEAMEAYLWEKATLEDELESLNRQLENELDYKENSPLMEISPYDKAVTIMNIAITDLEESAFLQVYQKEGTPVDFIVSRIQNQYLVLWRGVDLQEELSSDMSDKYVREVAGVEAESGGLMKIIAYGTTKQESQALAHKVHDFLVENSAVVAQSAYPHGFVLLSESTKIQVDTALEDTQKKVDENIETCTQQILEAEDKLAKLAEPVPETRITLATALRSGIKYGVLGAAAGVFLGALWALIAFLISGKLVFSGTLEQKLGGSMMGRVSGKKEIWNTLADRIQGERVWPSEEAALEYLQQSAKVRLTPGEKIALLTTLNEDEASPLVHRVAEKLGQAGFAVRFVGNACYDARVLSAIAECDSVILMERCGASVLAAIDTVAALAREQGKPVKAMC